MQNYTLKLKETDAKSIALINYLKTLDFVELSKDGDWWDELEIESKSSIERGLNDIKNTKTHSDENVRSAVRKRILKVQNK